MRFQQLSIMVFFPAPVLGKIPLFWMKKRVRGQTRVWILVPPSSCEWSNSHTRLRAGRTCALILRHVCRGSKARIARALRVAVKLGWPVRWKAMEYSYPFRLGLGEFFLFVFKSSVRVERIFSSIEFMSSWAIEWNLVYPRIVTENNYIWEQGASSFQNQAWGLPWWSSG